MNYRGQHQFNDSNTVTSDNGRIFVSGNKSVNSRLGLVKGMGGFGLTASKTSIDNSSFYCNEYGIPTPGSLLDITFPVSIITLGIASTSTNDNPSGSGARTILINGLDSNYDEMSEVVTLNGLLEVNSTKQFLRVQSAVVMSSGSTGWNEGTIYIGGSDNTFTVGVPQQNVYRTIGIDSFDNKGIGLSTPSTNTIPRGLKGITLNFKIDTDATLNKPLLVRAIYKPFGMGELTVGNLVFAGSEEFTFDGFPLFEEKTDIIIRTKAKTQTDVDIAVIYWEFNFVDTKIINIFN